MYDKARILTWGEFIRRTKKRGNKKYPNAHIVARDTKVILKAAIEELAEDIAAGYKVRLGEIGYIYTSTVRPFSVSRNSSMFPNGSTKRRSQRKIYFKPSSILKAKVADKKFQQAMNDEMMEVSFRKLAKNGMKYEKIMEKLEEQYGDEFLDWNERAIKRLEEKRAELKEAGAEEEEEEEEEE